MLAPEGNVRPDWSAVLLEETDIADDRGDVPPSVERYGAGPIEAARVDGPQATLAGLPLPAECRHRLEAGRIRTVKDVDTPRRCTANREAPVADGQTGWPGDGCGRMLDDPTGNVQGQQLVPADQPQVFTLRVRCGPARRRHGKALVLVEGQLLGTGVIDLV